jgi:hypothetical protein
MRAPGKPRVAKAKPLHPILLSDVPPSSDERHSATATCNSREDTLCRIANGEEVADLSMFPCSAEIVRGFRSMIQNRIPGYKQAVRAGGLNAHYDIEFQTDTSSVRAELKVTKKKASSTETLRWTPWVDTVQFLQGQIGSQLGMRFLGECGEPMLRAWFQEVIVPFSTKVPAAANMTYEGYEKAMATIQMKGKQEEASVAFINTLRTNDTLQEELHQHWLNFEVRWLSEHTLNTQALEEVVRGIIESKDAWICVASNQIQIVDGLKVIRVESAGPVPKKKGGMLFQFRLTLQSGQETKEVPMECKFHWKNGGQAVQNLNFMML